MVDTPRPEYPRPQFVRENWQNLNGTWQFAFDDDNQGLAKKWFEGGKLDQEILVPFTFQSALSGIGNNDFHDWVWYERSFEVPADWAGKRLLLHFGAVDYRTWVWINGIFVTFNEGGHTPFSADITDFVNEGQNTVVLRVEDISDDVYQPRGKQYWQRDSASIFYTRTTGIWQTVWLEPVSDCYLENIKITPDLDAHAVTLEYDLGGTIPENVSFEATVSFDGQQIVRETLQRDDMFKYSTQVLSLGDDIQRWTPEDPNLYDLKIRMFQGGSVLDSVSSYFGMRKISIENGKVCLNNQPYYMRLVLDQGYHPEGILVFPTDEDFKKDIELTKQMGLNGVRKHQKVEDPRYLYWADKMGLLVWGEMANAYAFSAEYIGRITAEWQKSIKRDYSHPCIVAWVPMNESWGVPTLLEDSRQRDHLDTMYHLTKSLDPTRLVVSNDGWEHATTDMLTMHDYEASGEVLTARYESSEAILASRPANREMFVTGASYEGQPILLTEFGGVAYRKSEQEGWGYSTAGDEEDFLKRLKAIMDAVNASSVLQGYCYTQLTDVEQEINGLLTYDRQPKTDLEAIAKLMRGE